MFDWGGSFWRVEFILDAKESLKILDPVVGISEYVNSNHVWSGIKEASGFETQSRIRTG